MEDIRVTSSHPGNSLYPSNAANHPPLGYPPVAHPYPPTAPPAGYPSMAQQPTGYPPVAHPYPPTTPPAGYPPAAYPPVAQQPMGYPPTAQPYPPSQQPPAPHQAYHHHHAGASSGTAPQQPVHAAGYSPLAAAAQMQQPVNTKQVVVDAKYLTPSIVDLVVFRQMSLKEGTFGVTDLKSNILFTLKGKMFSLHDKRVLFDAQDKPIVSFQQQILSMHRRWNAFRGESLDPKDLIFTVKKSSAIQFGTGLHVFLANNSSNDEPDFRIKGGNSESSCTIFAADRKTVLCQMRRQHNTAGNLLFGMDKFGVTVYPNVDVAFIVALIVILEEINQDRNGQDYYFYE